MFGLLKWIYQFVKNNVYPLTGFFCAICTFAILLVKVKFLRSFHPDISGSERSTTYGIQLVADYQQLYTDPEQPPFWITHYSPLYYYAVGLPYRLMGWDPADIYRIQLASRFASFGFVLLALVVIYFTGKHILRLRFWQNALLVMAIFALLQHWHLTNSRIDSLLFLFSTLFLYCGLRAFQEPADTLNKYLVAAGIAAILAFFSKQSGLVHIICILSFLLINARWKTLFKLAGIMFGFGLALTLLFSGGNIWLFFLNIFGSLASPILPAWFYYYTFEPLLPVASELITVCFLIGFKWYFAGKNIQRHFLVFAGLLFFGFATGTAFKYGAAVGYYHEFAYAGILTVFWYFCEQFERRPYPLSYYLLPAMLAITMLFFSTYQVERYLTANLGQYEQAYREQKQVSEYMVAQLGEQDEVVTVLGDGFRGYMLQQLLFRHQLAYQDDVIHFLNKNKTLNYSRFFDMANRGGVKYIILPKPQPLYFTAFDYTFDQRQYTLQKVLNGYHIYQSKELTPTVN
ncbi:glycosyltransferase family 39 protein [Spirosoma montaniterrae]|uniref:Uncharacterized protein n=1 Tax=Spirosoma montaniterrae TaxID=1178516 RepID=A0A1P9X0N1_9BACT|nr:glycosyltransferase family 39 protein [Spirosoma montaniterrae]AQG81197.1 hypothetical protein AWR27_18855 [Spirosoma montaniterrae]